MTLELETYDAGLLGNAGGGDVDWWQDYIRQLLEDAHLHYKYQVEEFTHAITLIDAGIANPADIGEVVEAAKQASEIVTRYRAFLGIITSDELEMHPYIPEVERVDDDLRAALAKLDNEGEE